MQDPQDQVARNVEIHDRIATSYEQGHGEIFNEVEQRRLRNGLARARGLLGSAGEPLALDYGCGSGNLTRHLLQLDFSVVAADVSRNFLNEVNRKYPKAQTVHLGADGQEGLQNHSFDLIGVYSVLHHIPDYLQAVRFLAGLCKPGGLLFLDHEPTPESWTPQPDYLEFLKKARRMDWKKFFIPGNYVGKFRRLFNPRYTNEGDIHVWPDDHVEWPKIISVLQESGFETVACEDYLLFRALYRPEVYEQWRTRLTDTRLMIFQKAPQVGSSALEKP